MTHAGYTSVMVYDLFYHNGLDKKRFIYFFIHYSMVLDCSVSDEILTFSSDTEICIPRFFVGYFHHGKNRSNTNCHKSQDKARQKRENAS